MKSNISDFCWLPSLSLRQNVQDKYLNVRKVLILSFRPQSLTQLNLSWLWTRMSSWQQCVEEEVVHLMVDRKERQGGNIGVAWDKNHPKGHTTMIYFLQLTHKS